jgi:hypothetical protein
MSSYATKTSKIYGSKIAKSGASVKSTVGPASPVPIKSTEAVKNSIDKTKTPKLQCESIRSTDEPNVQCPHKRKEGSHFCPIHSKLGNPIKYKLYTGSVTDEIFDLDEEILSVTQPPIKMNSTNSLIHKVNLNKPLPKITPTKNLSDTASKGKSVLNEQKMSTVLDNHKENADDLEVKLLILINDDEYNEKLAKLIGPVFADVTLSEDENDPVTLDPIWEMVDDKKVPAEVNKYFLFSYTDSKDKIRCFTIFTVQEMIEKNEFVHPITMEPIGEKDIKRAKKLVGIYSTKLNLFKTAEEDNGELTAYNIKNRTIKLFKKFHVHSIYLEEEWFTSIDSMSNLYKIASETEKLVSNNVKSINPTLKSIDVFRWGSSYGKKAPKKNVDEEDLLELKQKILDDWNKIMSSTDTPKNQLPIWIIASGLSYVVPAIKTKYPDLEIMNG